MQQAATFDCFSFTRLQSRSVVSAKYYASSSWRSFIYARRANLSANLFTEGKV